MKKGDRVFLEAWNIASGNRIEEYEIVSITAESIELRHILTHRKAGNSVEHIPANQIVLKYGQEMIEHLQIPFDIRWQRYLEEMRWLVEKLNAQ